jgi:hypothetical protein
MKLNFPDVPIYKKGDFSSVEALYDIFEKPIKNINIDKLNNETYLEQFQTLRNYYNSKDIYFTYHIGWEFLNLLNINWESISKKDATLLQNYWKPRSLDMKPYKYDYYKKLFDRVEYFIKKFKKNKE